MNETGLIARIAELVRAETGATQAVVQVAISGAVQKDGAFQPFHLSGGVVVNGEAMPAESLAEGGGLPQEATVMRAADRVRKAQRKVIKEAKEQPFRVQFHRRERLRDGKSTP